MEAMASENLLKKYQKSWTGMDGEARGLQRPTAMFVRGLGMGVITLFTFRL